MDGTTLEELRELVAFLKSNGIAEFEMERPDLKVRLKFESKDAPSFAAADLAHLSHMVASSHASASSVPASSASLSESRSSEIFAESIEDESPSQEVKSPIVGTFYESPSPGAPAFVKVGDLVEIGQVLCIIEAMKLMNEIESDVAGEVIRRIASSGQPVEYGQPLFTIRPR
jgi:acetyl-CoA carboxylase biotin carboxyl carrier protein